MDSPPCQLSGFIGPSGDEILTLSEDSGGMVSLADSPDGRHLVAGSVAGTARVRDATP